MTSICFVVRPSSNVKKPGSLILRIIHCRKVRHVTLQDCHIYPHEWDMKSQSIMYSADNLQRHSFLKTVEQKIEYEKGIIENYVAELRLRGQYCVDDIINLYRRESSNNNLLGYTGLLIRELERNGNGRTARAYDTVTKGFIAFSGKKDIELCQIDPCLIKSFESYLRNKGKKSNTISYYMRNLRAIYNKAVASGYVLKYNGEKLFARVYTGVDKTVKRAITCEELKSLYSFAFSEMLRIEETDSQNLYLAWRFFFFCFYARGMCFVDLAYLRKDNIKNGIIRYSRKKTGQQIEVKIIPELQNIIDSFASEVKYSEYVFPIIKDATRNPRLQYENGLNIQNRRLKKLSLLVGIRPVSTHVARHTWASIGKKENVPLRVISECLGHSSEKTTLIYMGLLDNSVLDEANDLITSVIARPRMTTIASLDNSSLICGDSCF